MATTQSHWESPVPPSNLDGAVKEYSRDRTYVITFLVLFVITVVEVVTYFATDFPLFKDPFLVPTLIFLAAVKFFIVAYIFMHLRFDKKLLSWIFYGGLVLALMLYLAVLTVFRVWWPGYHAVCESSPKLAVNDEPVVIRGNCPKPAGVQTAPK